MYTNGISYIIISTGVIKDQGECGTRGAAEVLLKDVIKSLSSKFEHHNVKLIYRVAEDSTDALSCLSKQCDAGSAFFFWSYSQETGKRAKSK